MIRVIIESPYAGRGRFKWLDRYLNKRFARRCMKDSLSRGEAPLASHLLYTQILRDSGLTRIQGMNAGFSWMAMADKVAVYCDRGITPGMMRGIKMARKLNIPVEERIINKNIIRTIVDANPNWV